MPESGLLIAGILALVILGHCAFRRSHHGRDEATDAGLSGQPRD